MGVEGDGVGGGGSEVEEVKVIVKPKGNLGKRVLEAANFFLGWGEGTRYFVEGHLMFAVRDAD